MKAIVKETKEIVDVRRNDEGIYIQETELRQWRYPHELEILGYTFEEVEEIKERVKEQYKSEIDWEQRRYEIAKAALIGIISAPIIPGVCPYPTPGNDAAFAIKYADELIKELKGE